MQDSISFQTKAVAKGNGIQDQKEEGAGRIPGQGGNSRVNTVGIHGTAVSSRRPIRHRAAVLQSVRGERGREGRGCRTVVTSPSGEGRSRDALLQLPTEPLCTDKTRVPRIQRAVRERVKEAIRDNRFLCDCTFPLYCCYYYYFISIAGILSVAFRRGNSTTSQSVLRLRIQEGSITWRSRMQLCKNTNIRGFLLHGL